MHLGTSVVERRNAQENILMLRIVMMLLHLCRMHQTPVTVQNGLGETCGAGGKVNCRLILVMNRHMWRLAGAVGSQEMVILCKGRCRRAVPYIQQKMCIRDSRLRPLH